MKWKRSNKQEELKQLFLREYHEYVTMFLWLPLEINGEWRWLETVTAKRMVFYKTKRRTIRYYFAYVEWM